MKRSRRDKRQYAGHSPKPDPDDRHRQPSEKPVHANRRIKESAAPGAIRPEGPLAFFHRDAVEERVQAFILSRMTKVK